MAKTDTGRKKNRDKQVMITLSQALRLCKCNEIYLIASNDKRQHEFWFWVPRLRELVDMKKIHVVRIIPVFEPYGPAFNGLGFIIRGLNMDTLNKLYFRSSFKERGARI